MSSNRFDVSGKVAIVTGGNVGIGENIARTLLQEGCSVVTCSRRDYPTPPAAEGLSGVDGRAHARLVVPQVCHLEPGRGPCLRPFASIVITNNRPTVR